MAAYCAVVLTVSMVVHWTSMSVFGSFAPENAAQSLQTTFQVQAALLALAGPFLLLLIQFSHDSGVAARPTSEVLARETSARAVMEFAVGGLMVVAIVSNWLVSDGAVIIVVVLVTAPTVLLVAQAYVISLNLLLNASALLRKSSELLQAKLKGSMRELWVLQRGNELLLSQLAQHGVVASRRALVRDDERWWPLIASRSGRIADMNLPSLVALLTSFPRAVPSVGPPPEPAPSIGHAPLREESPLIYMLHECGDRVAAGAPIFLLNREAFDLSAVPAVPLDRAIRIEPDYG